MTTTIRPVSTMVLIGLSETNTIGFVRLLEIPYAPAGHADGGEQSVRFLPMCLPHQELQRFQR